MRLTYAGLRMAFSDSLPRATIEKIARRPSLLKLEGETRTITFKKVKEEKKDDVKKDEPKKEDK